MAAEEAVHVPHQVFEQETEMELLLTTANKCRLCMKVPEEMDESAWHLFEDQIDDESLATHVLNFFQLQVCASQPTIPLNLNLN